MSRYIINLKHVDLCRRDLPEIDTFIHVSSRAVIFECLSQDHEVIENSHVHTSETYVLALIVLEDGATKVSKTDLKTHVNTMCAIPFLVRYFSEVTNNCFAYAVDYKIFLFDVIKMKVTKSVKLNRGILPHNMTIFGDIKLFFKPRELHITIGPDVFMKIAVKIQICIINFKVIKVERVVDNCSRGWCPKIPPYIATLYSSTRECPYGGKIVDTIDTCDFINKHFNTGNVDEQRRLMKIDKKIAHRRNAVRHFKTR